MGLQLPEGEELGADQIAGVVMKVLDTMDSESRAPRCRTVDDVKEVISTYDRPITDAEGFVKMLQSPGFRLVLADPSNQQPATPSDTSSCGLNASPLQNTTGVDNANNTVDSNSGSTSSAEKFVQSASSSQGTRSIEHTRQSAVQQSSEQGDQQPCSAVALHSAGMSSVKLPSVEHILPIKDEENGGSTREELKHKQALAKKEGAPPEKKEQAEPSPGSALQEALCGLSEWKNRSSNDLPVGKGGKGGKGKGKGPPPRGVGATVPTSKDGENLGCFQFSLSVRYIFRHLPIQGGIFNLQEYEKWYYTYQ